MIDKLSGINGYSLSARSSASAYRAGRGGARGRP